MTQVPIVGDHQGTSSTDAIRSSLLTHWTRYKPRGAPRNLRAALSTLFCVNMAGQRSLFWAKSCLPALRAAPCRLPRPNSHCKRPYSIQSQEEELARLPNINPDPKLPEPTYLPQAKALSTISIHRSPTPTSPTCSLLPRASPSSPTSSHSSSTFSAPTSPVSPPPSLSLLSSPPG